MKYEKCDFLFVGNFTINLRSNGNILDTQKISSSNDFEDISSIQLKIFKACYNSVTSLQLFVHSADKNISNTILVNITLICWFLTSFVQEHCCEQF